MSRRHEFMAAGWVRSPAGAKARSTAGARVATAPSTTSWSSSPASPSGFTRLKTPSRAGPATWVFDTETTEELEGTECIVGMHGAPKSSVAREARNKLIASG